MINTPVTLHSLDDENAIFVGLAEQTFTRRHPFGEYEVEGHYPAVFLQREVWENMGRPTALMLSLIDNPPDVPLAERDWNVPDSLPPE